jgi:hypothetical protein
MIQEMMDKTRYWTRALAPTPPMTRQVPRFVERGQVLIKNYLDIRKRRRFSRLVGSG